MKSASEILHRLNIDLETWLKEPNLMALQLIEAGINSDRWISVGTELPEDGQPVLVVGAYGKKLVTCPNTAYYTDNDWVDNSNDLTFSRSFIKFWQPIPTPPKR